MGVFRARPYMTDILWITYFTYDLFSFLYDQKTMTRWRIICLRTSYQDHAIADSNGRLIYVCCIIFIKKLAKFSIWKDDKDYFPNYFCSGNTIFFLWIEREEKNEIIQNRAVDMLIRYQNSTYVWSSWLQQKFAGGKLGIETIYGIFTNSKAILLKQMKVFVVPIETWSMLIQIIIFEVEGTFANFYNSKISRRTCFWD